MNIRTKFPQIEYTPYQVITNSVQQIKEVVPKGSTIKVVIYCTLELFPYLKEDYKLVDYNDNPIPSLETYQTIYQQYFPYQEAFLDKYNKGKYLLTRVQHDFDIKNKKHKVYNFSKTYKMYYFDKK